MMIANLWALGALVVGLVLLWIFLIRLIRGLTHKAKEGKKSRAPAGVSFVAIVLAVVLLGFSWVLFWMGHQLRTFKPVALPGVIGRIDVVHENDPMKTLRVNFYSVSQDSLSKPTNFYLTGNSYRVSGQFVRLPAFLSSVFEGRNFCKVTDFQGQYIGHKPPGFESALFEHQQIGGGRVDVLENISLLPLVRKLFNVCEFESEPQKIKDRGVYDLVLSDDCKVSNVKAK
jgi:hypothetical protein